MHRIDDPSNVPTLPAPRPPGTPGYFTGGSPGSSGFAATVVRYEWTNAVQEELAAIVAAAGLALDKTNNNQVLQALRQMLRFKLSQDETFYIDPNGNDTNDGLTETTALATGQAAWNKALTIDLNNHNLFLQFANGTYTTPMLCQGAPLGIGAASGIVVQGNVAQPSQVTFSTTNVSCITAAFGASVYVEGVTLRATGVPAAYQNMGAGLMANTAAEILFGNVIFDRCDWTHMIGIGGGVVRSLGNPYTVAAGGGYHMMSTIGGYVANVNSAVSLTGTPNFTNAFVYSGAQGMTATYGAAYSGPVTGKVHG